MDCRAHLAALEAAPTLDDLQAAFKTAYKAAQTENDTVAMAILTGAKNNRKTALGIHPTIYNKGPA